MMSLLISAGLLVGAVVLTVVAVKELLGLRYIPHTKVGVIEKLWSKSGSITEGQVVALNGEAGYQSRLLRGGVHLWLWRWQYRIHTSPLVTIPQSKIGYVYSRDGEPLGAGQTLGRVVNCNNYQNAEMFLEGAPRGQRGRQRAILREGVYAINPALFVVITEDQCYKLDESRDEAGMVTRWQKELKEIEGFSPVVIGAFGHTNSDDIGIVTVQDGPSLATGEIIAPAATDHNNYQDPEAFVTNGGRRGRQYVPLTDGTYFINRWFASVELVPKTVVQIGTVGVVVSYFGREGHDVSGDKFRHGERVAKGEKGVWADPLGPGKYAFNTYAGQVVQVPTTNFVLHWITGKSEGHRYDENLKSIDLVTKDAYEPTLPLSLVVHIDYAKAPGVIQRFGDVKKLITQTIDPMLSAFFRDVAHKRTMLELLQNRDAIQQEAKQALRERFEQFDIECVDVLIGKPETGSNDGKIETLLEQLRQRQLAKEQIETYEHQRRSAEEQRKLTEARATADRQQALTESKVAIEIAQNQGAAELARAEMMRSQTIVEADANLERAKKAAQQTVVAAEAASKQRVLEGEGESQKVLKIGEAEAEVQRQKVESFGDPRLYASYLVAGQLAQSRQPLVPEHIITSGGETGVQNLMTTLLQMMVSEKAGITLPAAHAAHAAKGVHPPAAA
jgi:uncharacterized membrane protein YqiK